jgi:hypothetical protein
VNTLTIALEALLAAIGLTVAVGTPLVGIHLQRRGAVTRAEPELVRVGRVKPAAQDTNERELVAA